MDSQYEQHTTAVKKTRIKEAACVNLYDGNELSDFVFSP